MHANFHCNIYAVLSLFCICSLIIYFDRGKSLNKRKQWSVKLQNVVLLILSDNEHNLSEILEWNPEIKVPFARHCLSLILNSIHGHSLCYGPSQQYYLWVFDCY